MTGRVQGVCFRYCASEEAERLGLAGWIKNLPDGRVEAEFEGPRSQLEVMLDWCKHGPRGAVVTSKSRPVISLTAAMTLLTEWPLPEPRLKDRD